jgi:hypothetical protein
MQAIDEIVQIADLQIHPCSKHGDMFPLKDNELNRKFRRF